MANNWSFIAGFFLTAACLIIGLWANLMLSGDPLAVAKATSSVVEGSTILFTTLFIGLSGGHYIGASFESDSSGRWFALGANSVLWLVLMGFIGLQVTKGGNILGPAIYAAALLFTSGGVFALHKSGQVENRSKLDEYIELFSSKGTALIVTISFIVRTVPKPMGVGIATVGLILLAIVLWSYYDEQREVYIRTIRKVIADMTSTDDRQGKKLE